jgi:hypothetical protein
MSTEIYEAHLDGNAVRRRLMARPRDIRRGENSRGMDVKASDIYNKCMANKVHATSIGDW